MNNQRFCLKKKWGSSGKRGKKIEERIGAVKHGGKDKMPKDGEKNHKISTS